MVVLVCRSRELLATGREVDATGAGLAVALAEQRYKLKGTAILYV